MRSSIGRVLDSDDSTRRSTGRQERLLAEVAAALRANLARGFLEGEERVRQIAEALNDVVLLSDEASGQAFGPEVPVPADAPVYDRLAGFFGRRPDFGTD